jgi:probable phosphoglycerate mutase
VTETTLYVLRHGETEWNVATRMQGRLDSPLTELGRRQADVHGRTLARLGPVDRLIVSPLGRTRATAELLNAHLGAEVTFEPALMERDCGAWSGMTIEEIEAAHPRDWGARNADPYGHRPPDGENLPDMEARVAGFLDTLDAQPGRTLGLVTHGVMSRVILKSLLQLSADVAVRVRHPNGLFYRLAIAEKGCFDSFYFFDGHGPTAGLLHKG